ncbi:hypothetical protein F2P81_023141 [Scophthalmus maximus]|uniref:Uncharacterized protein n=1 Tax=Scophthalmus maximus TaxID=52904 RepID=A0A6A4RVN2_SCOMX|nr:hypothetical protein F2P81_023141 [Scophthalmus maximus]
MYNCCSVSRGQVMDHTVDPSLSPQVDEVTSPSPTVQLVGKIKVREPGRHEGDGDDDDDNDDKKGELVLDVPSLPLGSLLREKEKYSVSTNTFD